MNEKEVRVTVILPTFNRPDYIREAVESVVRQEFQDWELLVINDGGEDVESTVKSFGDNRIRYVNRKKNRGKASCLNLALRMASGEYIAYLDDDDHWYPNHLKVLYEALERNPEFGAAYSDLYAVQFVRDVTTGKRYPVHKFIQVSRDFNRDFMFYFNHTLHVSLMHRKDLAIRVGGYNEKIRILIDWNITRKLCFVTDFKYVPVPTGEYYMPIGESDRISNLERKDDDRYNQNIRRIKADRPDKPWPKVDEVAVVFPVQRWDEATVETLEKIYDATHYPAEFILVNMDRKKSPASCKKALRVLSELKNIRVIPMKKGFGLGEDELLNAYRLGARKTNAEYIYLPTENAETDNKLKLMTARRTIKQSKYKGVKWKIDREMATPYDLFIERKHFLHVTSPDNEDKQTDLKLIDTPFPSTLKSDIIYSQAGKLFQDGNAELAFKLIEYLEKETRGGVNKAYEIDLNSKINFEIGQYDIAEEQCRRLIEQGYGADNWIRLGAILQARGEYDEAVDAYRKGLDGIEISEADLDSPVFPIAVGNDFGSFLAFMGIGECFLEKGMLAEAARMFRKSARLKANSHRPFLGFGKMFLATGDKQKAVEALEVASARAQGDGAPDLILGRIRERDGERASALQCYRKAFEKDNADPETMQLFFRTGMALEEYDTVRETFENVLEKKPASLSLKKRLALVAIKTGRFTDAADLLESCREAAPDDVEVQQLSRMVPTEIVAESFSRETANFAASEECSPEEAGGCVPEGARLSLSLPETGMNPPVQRDWVGT